MFDRFSYCFWQSFARAQGVTTTRTNNSCSNASISQAASTEMDVGCAPLEKSSRTTQLATHGLSLGRKCKWGHKYWPGSAARIRRALTRPPTLLRTNSSRQKTEAARSQPARSASVSLVNQPACASMQKMSSPASTARVGRTASCPGAKALGKSAAPLST